MGAKWDKLKEEWNEEKQKQQEKDRIKAEKKAEKERNLTQTDKVTKHAWDTARVYIAMKWLIPALLGVAFVVILLITWVLNQFGIYLG